MLLPAIMNIVKILTNFTGGLWCVVYIQHNTQKKFFKKLLPNPLTTDHKRCIIELPKRENNTKQGDNTIAFIIITKENGEFYFESGVELMLFLEDEGEGMTLDEGHYTDNATIYREL